MMDIKVAINLATEKILDYLRENQSLDTKVIDYQSAQSLREKIDLSLPENGIALEELIPVIESYLHHSTRTSSHKFFNQLWGGFEITGVLAEMVTSAANTSMYTYEVAPVATLMEMKLIETLNHLIGFNQGEGLMVTGGSNANLMGMLCARHRCLPQAKQDGLENHQLVAYVSEQSHYSFVKAANLLGIGIKNVIQVKSDPEHRMDPQALDLAIQQSLTQGEKPFFVGATAGTTVLGAFDPLPEIAEITRKYDLWLHVDGAWGGPVLFSKQHRHLLAGSELADSFTWDAHKLMGVPLICSAILVKQRGILGDLSSSGNTDYLFHDDQNSEYNLGHQSFQCGRKVDALKLWLSWKYHGRSGYEARVVHLFELTQYVSDYIRNCERLELMVQPSFLNICFRYNPSDRTLLNLNLDRINLEIRNKLIYTGQALVNYANYQDQIVIRLVVANPEVQKSDLDHFFEAFLQAGDRVLATSD